MGTVTDLARSLWLTVAHSRLLTRCFVAERGDLAFHVHAWRFRRTVREIWLVVPGRDRDGGEHVRVVPPEAWEKVMAATSFEHAAALVRAAGRRS